MTHQEILPGKPTCPQCHTIVDGYTHPLDEHIKLEDGACSICLYCATPLIYEKRKFRKTTPEELDELNKNPLFRTCVMAVQEIKKARDQ